MAKIKGKGTSLKQEISSVYTTIAQLIDLKKGGSKSGTYDSTTLDGGAAKTKGITGYAEPGTCSGSLFYDPALSGHQSFTDLIETPVETNFRITYADTGATTQTFAVAGFGFDVDVVQDDGVKGSFELEITGTAGWPT